MLEGIRKNIYLETGALKFAFSPSQKKNPDKIILHIRTNTSVNETSRDILKEILSLKNFKAKLFRTCKVIVLNIT